MVIRDKSCKYDLDRGLAFLGNVGAGKSFLLDQLVKFANTTQLTNSIVDLLTLVKSALNRI